MNREEIEKINKNELVKIYNNYKKLYKNKVTLDKKKKYIFTIKKYEVFLRLYVDENIQICIRTNTLNSQEKVIYEFVNFNTLSINNIEEYQKDVRLFFKNILKEFDNTLYCPEHHNEMIPNNATAEEIQKGWYNIYERRLLTELNYNEKAEFNEWLEKITDKKYIQEQKSICKN